MTACTMFLDNEYYTSGLYMRGPNYDSMAGHGMNICIMEKQQNVSLNPSQPRLGFFKRFKNH